MVNYPRLEDGGIHHFDFYAFCKEKEEKILSFDKNFLGKI